MEFARRSRSTASGDNVDDGSRPPPPHGGGASPAQGDVAALARKREALLLELHQQCVRQEIILRELAETERAMDERLAAAGHQPTPAPPFVPPAAGAWRGWPPAMPPWEEEVPFPWRRGSPPVVRVPLYPHVERSPSPTATPKPWPARDARQQERDRPYGSSAQPLWGKVPAVEEASNADAKPTLPWLFGGGKVTVTPRRQDATGVGQEGAAEAEDGDVAQVLKEAGNPSRQQPPKPARPIAGDWNDEREQPSRQYMPAGQVNSTFDEPNRLKFKELSPGMMPSGAKRELIATASPAKKQKPLGESSNQTVEVHCEEQQLHRPNLAVLQSGQRSSETTSTTRPAALARPESSSRCAQPEPAAMADDDIEKHPGRSRWRSHGEDKNATEAEINGEPRAEEDRARGKGQRKPPPLQEWRWRCGLCGARGYTEATRQEHFGGRRHRENLEAAKEGRPPGMMQKPPPSTWSSGSGPDLRDRLGGRRHRENAEAEDGDQRQRGVAMEEKGGSLVEYSCEDCGVRCNSEKMLESHLGGRKDREMLQGRSLS